MILEEGHIENDTIKYVKPLNLDYYKDVIIKIGSIMMQHSDNMSIQDMSYLKIAQATICQLGLEQELRIKQKAINDLKGEG